MNTTSDLLQSLRSLPSAEIAWLTEHTVTLRNHFTNSRPALADALNELCILLDSDIQDRPARDAEEVRALHRLMDDTPALPEDGDLDIDGGWTADRPKQDGL